LAGNTVLPGGAREILCGTGDPAPSQPPGHCRGKAGNRFIVAAKGTCPQIALAWEAGFYKGAKVVGNTHGSQILPHGFAAELGVLLLAGGAQSHSAGGGVDAGGKQGEYIALLVDTY